ncbi:MAG: protein tyrosine phosphatase [Nanoarchaeota archaeon]|nr:protein tyrosine phosphatase [Nanoarchaeota archaeon]
MNLLFICNQNKNRSKTAEELFRGRYITKSAGLFNGTPVTKKDLSWADAVIVMESAQRSELARRFPQLYMQKRILSFDIPDTYAYDSQKLKKVLLEKAEEYSSVLR